MGWKDILLIVSLALNVLSAIILIRDLRRKDGGK